MKKYGVSGSDAPLIFADSLIKYVKIYQSSKLSVEIELKKPFERDVLLRRLNVDKITSCNLSHLLFPDFEKNINRVGLTIFFYS